MTGTAYDASFSRIRYKTWKHKTTGLLVYLPDDKRTFRVLDADYNQIVPINFRSYAAAVRYVTKHYGA